jgi:prepilin-type N-terminal cleavage/methylation domain-containing protein
MLQESVRKKRAGEGGFTLIELLIVIVILGILAAIVVFAVGGITDRGTRSACQSDLKTVEVAEEAYFAQNDSYTDIPGLVTAKLLKTAPGTDNDYTISVNSGTGDVTASPACNTL